MTMSQPSDQWPQDPAAAEPARPAMPGQPAPPVYGTRPQDPHAQPPASAQQPYGQPGPAVQPYGQHPYGQQPDAGYPQPRATGGAAWGLGFLSFIPIPLIGLLACVGVMVGVGLSQRKHGGVAAENGRNAANWALTLLIGAVVAIALGILSIALVPPGSEDPMWLGVVAGLLLMALGITHLVTIILGLVKSGRGQVHRAPAIPFFRG
jgi:uncharacterized Tic20 family protein